MNKKYWVALAVVAVIAIGLGIAVKAVNVQASGGYPRVALVPLAAQHDGEDIQFATAMIPLAENAIGVASVAETRADSTSVKELAAEMVQVRTLELAEMQQWQGEWRELADLPRDAGGLNATGEAALQTTSGADFDLQFLTLMIDQHEQALAIARREIASGRYAPARDLANRIIAAQQSELDRMRSLLKKS